MVACNNDVLLNPSLNVLVNNNLSRECKIPCAVCQSHIMYSFTLQRAQGQKYKKKKGYMHDVCSKQQKSNFVPFALSRLCA